MVTLKRGDVMASKIIKPVIFVCACVPETQGKYHSGGDLEITKKK